MSSAPRTTLVVDDNEKLAALIEKYLRRDGFRPAHVASGAAALDWLAGQPADLLLLNLKLPDMTGEEVVQALEQRQQPIPFIVIAGHGDERRAADLLKRGALDYLMKDGTLLELMPAVLKRAVEQIERRQLLREAEIAYEHLRRHYEMILHAAGEGICGLDEHGRITFVNPAALRLLGYAMHELLGADLAGLAERPVTGTNGQIRAALAANTTFRSHDQVFWRKDGSCFPIEYTSTPIREDGQQIGSVFVFKDITERRRLEEQFRQAQKLEAVGRLAGGIAHDFNNLLTVVSGYSDLLAVNASLDAKAKEAVSEIQLASERASAVTRQLLAFGRKQMLQPRPLDLNAVITEINKLIRRLIGEDITLVTQLAPGLLPVTADPGQLEQVILNLAVNARDAMPQGGTLTITTGNVRVDEASATGQPDLRPGQFALLTVTDTGCGMDAPTRARIFEPFFTTKEPGRGTGLGLATVYGIVVQSGGHIDVQSELGRGTTFRILWPQADGPVELPAPTPPADATCGGTETVLLVEDEDSVRGLAARVLQSYGYKVLEARDGAEAQQIAQQNGHFLHLMLTDVVMPGISGLELARRLAPLRPKMKVLYMSGYTDDAIVRRGVLSPDAAFLQKPFTPDTLARRVREVLDQPAARAKPAEDDMIRMRVLDEEFADEVIQDRQKKGVDGPDEVWDGVYVVSPLANNPHQTLATRLARILGTVVEDAGHGLVQGGANVSDRSDENWVENYRVPDVVVVVNNSRAVDCGTHWMGGPDFLIEIQSPGDETDAKIPFYSRIGVRELLIIHRDTRQLRLFGHDGTDLAPVEPSDFRGKKWLRSAVVPLAFRRTVVKGQGPRTEVRCTDDTSGQWVI